MIKKILAWITGKSDTAVAEATPYKVEAQPAMTNVAIGTEAVYVAPEAVAPAEVVQMAIETAPEAVAPAEIVQMAIETAPVTVKAKYKKADLTKMTKAELMGLITKHGVEVKARSTKEELVTVLAKV